MNDRRPYQRERATDTAIVWYNYYTMNNKWNLQDWQIGYLAGLVDGEYHVGIQKMTGRNRATPSYVIRLELSMTTKSVVDFVNSLLPNSKVVKQITRGRRLPTYRLRMVHQEAIAFLRMVHPYLQGKQKQVALCLELEELRKELSPSRKHVGKKHFQRMPNEYAIKAEKIFIEFRKGQMNKKPRKKEVKDE